MGSLALNSPKAGPMADTRLTPKQASILKYIYDYTCKHGYQPSFQDMVDAFGYGSRNSIMVHMVPLQRKGWLRLGLSHSRAVRLLRKPDGTPFKGFVAR